MLENAKKPEIAPDVTMEDKQKPAEKVLPVKRKARKEVALADLSIAEKTHDQQHPSVNADPMDTANYVMKTDNSGQVPISCNRRQKKE